MAVTLKYQGYSKSKTTDGNNTTEIYIGLKE